LNRSGARIGTALTTTLLTFVGTMLALLGFGLYSLFFSRIGDTGPFFMGAVTTFALASAFLIFSAAWPGFFRVGIGAAPPHLASPEETIFCMTGGLPAIAAGLPRTAWMRFPGAGGSRLYASSQPAAISPSGQVELRGFYPRSLAFLASRFWPISVSVF
jgi:hypothetical protein